MIKKCKFCSKIIPRPLFTGTTYCNEKCRYNNTLKKIRIKNKTNENWNKERSCVLCDKKFIPKSSNQKFCSKKCTSNVYDFNYVHANLNKLKNKEPFLNLNLRWLKLRITLFDRDEFTCKYCGRSPMKDKNVILHIDHKIPKKKGGTDDLNNLITSCEQCNLGKSDLLLNYWKSKNENS